jgi:hypothetical protein
MNEDEAEIKSHQDDGGRQELIIPILPRSSLCLALHRSKELGV